MQVELRGVAPGPLTASLALRGRTRPQWRLRGQLEGFDPALFTGAETAPAWYATLAADGGRRRGDARGPARSVATSHCACCPRACASSASDWTCSRWRWSAGRTRDADRAGGFRRARKRELAGQVQARGLTWGEGEAQVLADGDFRLAGTTKQWSALGKATLARAGAARNWISTRSATRAHAPAAIARGMASGRLEASGELAWSPALAWKFEAQLAGFDPGYFAPDWPAAVDGEARFDGTRVAEGALDMHLLLRELAAACARGRWRAMRTSASTSPRRPKPQPITQARSRCNWATAAWKRMAASPRRCRWTRTSARCSSPTCCPTRAACCADACSCVARAARPTSISTWRARSCTTAACAPAACWHAASCRGAAGARGRTARGGQRARARPAFREPARGRARQLRAARARCAGGSGAGRSTLRGASSAGAAGWQGTLAIAAPGADARRGLATRPRDGLPLGAGRGPHHAACLRSEGEARSPVRAGRVARQGRAVQGSGLSLALLQGYLPEREGGGRWRLHGDFALDAQVRPRGDSWRGEATITSASGGLAPLRRRPSGRPPPPDLARYEQLQARADFDPAGLRATLGANLDGGGRVDAQLASGWNADSALVGTVAIATTQIGWLELFSPDIVAPSGRLEGHLQLGGTRAHPRLGGDAQLSAFRAEVPALGITLRDGQLRMDAQPDGNARLSGQVEFRARPAARRRHAGLGPGDEPAAAARDRQERARLRHAATAGAGRSRPDGEVQRRRRRDQGRRTIVVPKRASSSRSSTRAR
jgi:translocation and assembly module TamB